MRPPPENARAARTRSGPATDEVTIARSHPSEPRASRIPLAWLRERDRLAEEVRRTGKDRDRMALIVHQCGIVARLEGEPCHE